MAEALSFSAFIHRDQQNGESKGQSEGNGGCRRIKDGWRASNEKVDDVPIRRVDIKLPRRMGSKSGGEIGGRAMCAGAFCQA